MALNSITSNFFGIPETTDPRELLGVPIGRHDTLAIKNALRRRLAQLHVHPLGYSEEANDIRDYLASLAKELSIGAPDSIPNNKGKPAELTPLDQAIIAALVSERGWNKNSRARLVSIAASYSITVGGLMRILEAFAEAARAGSGPLSAQQRSTYTITRHWATMPNKPSAFSKVDTFIADTAKRLTPELSSPNPVMTMKLAILFALLTVIAFVLALQVLLPSEDDYVLSNDQGNLPSSSIISNEIIVPDNVLLVSYPSFHVDGIESNILDNSDRGIVQLSVLQDCATDISESISAGKPPSKETLKRWSGAIKTLSSGWPYIDQQTLVHAKSLIVKIILLAEIYPDEAYELLDEFKVRNLSSIDSMELTRAVWNVGILASLGCDHRLNANVRTYIKKIQLQDVATCEQIDAEIYAMQHYATVLLARTEFEINAFKFWETWLIIAKRLQAITGKTEPYVYLTLEILHSNIDLLRESKTRQVLGRLIDEVAWSSSLAARNTVFDAMQSEDVYDIAILSSLYHLSDNITWYSKNWIVALDSDFTTRQKIADELFQDWPINTLEQTAVWNLSIPTGFYPEFFTEWKNQLKTVSNQPDAQLVKLARLRLLNESAVSAWKGRPDMAMQALHASKRFELDTEEYFHPYEMLRDGTLKKIYSKAGNDQYEQLDAIDTLYNSSETDLGPEDADLLASVALTHRKSAIRIAATQIIVQQYNNGPNMATALVNNFSKAQTKEQIATLVAHLSNVILPDKQSPQWESEARRALVQHALTAGDQLSWELDEVSSVLSTSLLSEYLLLNPNVIQLADEVNASEAISMVVDTWIQALPPEYLPDNTIAFNPTGVLQRYLLRQLQYFTLLEAEESRWRSKRNPISNTLTIATTLSEIHSIMEQLIVVEQAIAEHWEKLFQDIVIEFERRTTQ